MRPHSGAFRSSSATSAASSSSPGRRDFADSRAVRLVEIDLRGDDGFDVRTAAQAIKRACEACGLSERHLFDAAARDGGYDGVVAGHHLGDEAAVRFGNLMRWDSESFCYFGFLDGASRRLVPESPPQRGVLRACTRCGAATTPPGSDETPVCAFCRLVDNAAAHGPIPVAAPRRR